MEELKQALQSDALLHVKEVWFDANGNWYLRKGRTTVRSMTRAEILGEQTDLGFVSEEEAEKPKKKFRKSKEDSE